MDMLTTAKMNLDFDKGTLTLTQKGQRQTVNIEKVLQRKYDEITLLVEEETTNQEKKSWCKPEHYQRKTIWARTWKAWNPTSE